LSHFNETWIFLTYFQKIFKHQISWKPVYWGPSCSMQMDGQTAVLTKLKVTFHNFANHCMLYLLYITDNNRAYYRFWILVSNTLSLAIGLKLEYCAPWRWYACTKTCKCYIFSIHVYLRMCNWLVQMHWCFAKFSWQFTTIVSFFSIPFMSLQQYG
jgi:hypothetical protein